ncbi:DEAD/DEAH box helicase [Brachybacterium sp. JHP9]|uniref:DEAD/DEAH box helicase n=1 Tax=Brachybacterium equifaecis TaxID=2910770 RepID=A0ABT0R290_9MICO|nr:DEAD/DEAH box helicase [Brachybacterium equifaecis]
MSTPDFARLGVPQNLIDALAPQGITSPTPIQLATLPDSLAGRDVLGRGRTGSGKTYAFLLPLAARLAESRTRPAAKRPRSLILAPTRELAAQIGESLAPLAKAANLSYAVIFGGVGQRPQADALQRGLDVLIACPGRLLDLMGQGLADLSAIEVTILDEADHMADMGFLPMVRRILDKTPQRGQRMLFSATLDAGVNTVVKQYLHNPVTHEADPETSPVGTMEHHILEVTADDRLDVLRDLASAPGKTIMFTRTKHGAKKLARTLVASGIGAVELHGNLSQGARTRNMEAFGSGAANTLVCTDIAARGIHVDEVALVVHADPPIEHKAYLHRSGRTARAGESGTVITVQTPDQRGDVNVLMRAAKISPERHQRVTESSPILASLAPGERVRGEVDAVVQEAAGLNRTNSGRPKQPAQGGGRGRGGQSGSGQGGSGQGGSGRGGRGAQGGRGGQGGRSGRSGQGSEGRSEQRRDSAASSEGSTSRSSALDSRFTQTPINPASEGGRGRGGRGGSGQGGSGRGGQGGSGQGRSGSSRGRSGGRSGGSGSTTTYSTSTGGSSGDLAAFSSRRGR